jgi:AraC-like DNA-binding protein
MYFDVADIVTITTVIELFFFIVFISFKSINPYPNKLLLIVFTSQMLGIIAFLLTKHHVAPDLGLVLKSFYLLWGPSLFIYVEALTRKREKFGRYLFFHSLPFNLFLIYSLAGMMFELPTVNINLFGATQVVVYCIAGLIILSQYHRKVKENFSRDESRIRNWAAVSLLGYIVACYTPVIFQISGFYYNQSEVFQEVIEFLPFLIFFNILFFNAIGNPVVINEIPKEEKYLGSNLTEENARSYMQKLDDIVEKGKYYLELELTLNNLAEVSGIPSRYLSQIINQYKQMSFYDYINGLRIEHACKLLTEDSKKTILEILYESGFNSKTSFNTSFKKHTGLTPSQFKVQRMKKVTDEVDV